MRAEVGGGGRTTVLRPLMIARGLLSAMSFAALTAWDPVLAEDKILRISGAGKAAIHRLRQFHASVGRRDFVERRQVDQFQSRGS